MVAGPEIKDWYMVICKVQKNKASGAIREQSPVTNRSTIYDLELRHLLTPPYVYGIYFMESFRSRNYEIHCLYDHPQAMELRIDHKQFSGRIFDAQRANGHLAKALS